VFLIQRSSTSSSFCCCCCSSSSSRRRDCGRVERRRSERHAAVFVLVLSLRGFGSSRARAQSADAVLFVVYGEDEDKTHKKLGNVPRRDDVSKQKIVADAKKIPRFKKSAPACSPQKKKVQKRKYLSLSLSCSFFVSGFKKGWAIIKESPTRSEIRSPFGKKNARARLYHYKKKAQLSRRQRRQQQKQRRVKRLFIHDAVQTDRFSIIGRRDRDRDRERQENPRHQRKKHRVP
jgi:hypothetical protein